MRSKKLEDVVEQFETWRGKPHGRLIPDSLWKAALGLLDRYAPSTICRHLRVNPVRFKQVREARGTVVEENRPLGRGRSGAAGRSTAPVMAFAPSRNTFVELAPLGVAVEGGVMAPPLREVQRGPTGCRLTLESAAGTLTFVTVGADRGLVDAFCRFVLGALADGARS